MRQHFLLVFILLQLSAIGQKAKLVVQAGHSKAINDIKFSPSGKWVATAAADGIRLWEARSGKLLHHLQEPGGSVDNIFFSHNGHYLISCMRETGMAVWDMSTGNKLYSLPDLASFTYSAWQHPNEPIAVLSDTRQALVVHLPTGKVLQRFDTHYRFDRAQFSGDGSRLLTFGSLYEESTFFYRADVWNTSTWEKQSSLRDTIGRSLSDVFLTKENNLLAWVRDSLDNQRLQLFSGEKEPKRIAIAPPTHGELSFPVFNEETQQVLYTNEGPTSELQFFEVSTLTNNRISNYKKNVDGINQSHFSPDGKMVITLSNDTVISVWESATGKFMRSVVIQAEFGAMLSISSDSKYLAVTDGDVKARLINLKTGRVIHTLAGADVTPRLAVFDSATGHIYSAHSDYFMRSWEPRLAHQQVVPVDMDGMANSLDISFTGEELAYTDNGGFMGVQNTRTGEDFFFLVPEFCSRFRSVDFHPSSRKLLGAACHQLEVIDMDTFSNYFTLQSPYKEDQFEYARFSPDGKQIAALNMQGDIFFWDLASKQRGLTIPYYYYRPRFFRYSPDSRYLALVGRDTMVRVFSFADSLSIIDIKIENSAYLYLAEISPNNSRILVGEGDSVFIFDFTTKKRLQSYFTGGRILSIDWTNDKMAVQRDGQLQLMTISTGKELYSIFAFEKDDYLFLLPDGKYKVTKNAASQLGWVQGDERYDFDQFDLVNNRPDIVLKAMGNTDTALLEAYTLAWKKRVKRAGLSPENLSATLHTPEIKITTAENLPLETNKQELTLEITATDSLYPLNKLFVWVNGVPVYGSQGKLLAGARQLDEKLPLKLSEGKNKIQVAVANSQGNQSKQPSVTIIYNPKMPQKTRTWFIGFGVNDYKDSRYTLQYSVKDIGDLAGWFSKFPNTTIDTFTDTRVTRENILAVKERLMKTGIEDRVIISFSGHGLLDDSLNFYYATQDVDFSHPEKRGLLYEEIESLLDGIPSRKKLLLIDACHSGESDKEEARPAPHSETNGQQDTGALLITRFGSRGTALLEEVAQSGTGLKNSFELMQELFSDLGRGTGACIISAAAGDSYAFEKNDLKNGVFTWCILNGLKNKAADINKDGSITVAELEHYVKIKVAEITNGKQVPTSRSGLLEYDWEF